MYDVIFAPEFTRWLESLNQSEKEDVLAALVVLRQYGHQLGRPHADTLKNSELTNLKELRIQHSGKPYRAFYIFDPYRQAVMLCGGDKTGDKRFYKRMIPIAENIYQVYLKTLDHKENKK
ncbi:type II toxin-antitoxin system RelE/ParE family toxin [uncultured Psychrobacter sp.]|uniref:type II toxin-antitoxin system RelE/ParE family toxin n=1 Tax=uncultured Psychrobacter sp. TaxID=259303 RepID=UPI00345B27E7